MNEIGLVRERLLQAAREKSTAARWVDRGNSHPNPSKLISEGIDAGRKAIEAAPVEGDLEGYLALLLKQLEEMKSQARANPTSIDGDLDEDGYILGGLTTVGFLVEAELQVQSKTRTSGAAGWRRLWKKLFG